MKHLRKGHLESIWTEVNGFRMMARVSVMPPAETALPLVLVPGLNLSSLHMLQLGELFAPYVRVYSPDLPGYGQSDKPDHFLTLTELTDALAGWMTALHLGQAALLGSSFSAQIVAHFAVRYPDRIARAMLLGPTVDPSSRPFPKLLWRWWQNERREPKHVGQITRQDYQNVSTRRALFTIGQMVRDRIEKHLPLMNIPTLVVRGSQDAVVSAEWAERASQLLPNGRLVVIPGGAHALNLDSPLEVTRVVRSFLREQTTIGR